MFRNRGNSIIKVIDVEKDSVTDSPIDLRSWFVDVVPQRREFIWTGKSGVRIIRPEGLGATRR